MATVTLFPQAQTVAGAPRVSSTFNYAGTRTVSVALQLVDPSWATEDPTITVSLEIQQSFDNGVTWQGFAAATWLATTVSGRTGALPALSATANDDLGARKVRAVLSLDKGTINTLGVTATT